MKFWGHVGLIGDLSSCEDVYRALNHNFFLTDTMMQLAVIDFVDELPESPEEQDVYILSQDSDPYKKNDLVMWDGKKWLQLDPKFGYVASVEALLKPYWYNGTEWVPLPSGPADVSGPSSSRDKSIARWDGVTGKILNDSSVYIDDDGNITDVTGLYSEKVNTTLIEGGNFIVEEIDPKEILLGGLFNTILDPIVEIESIELVPEIIQSSFFLIENKSGSDILVKENSSIFTGSGSDFLFKKNSSIVIYYSELTDTFNIISGGGSGSGIIVPDIPSRDAIPNAEREVGLTVTVLDDGLGRQKDYWLVGGITNSDWKEKKSGGGLLTVANEADRLAIPVVDKYDGLLVKQVDTGVIWAWNSPPAVSPDLPKWILSDNQSIVTILPDNGAFDGGNLSDAILAYNNTAIVIPDDNITLGVLPFGPGPYELGTTLLVVNMSDYVVEIPTGVGIGSFVGSKVNLSQRGETATFKLVNAFWVLIGRSN